MKCLKRILASILSAVIVFTTGAMLVSKTALAYNAGIEAFVNSLYSDCLGRSADPTGFNDWCNKLATGQITGKQAAYGFFFSPEFQAKANAWSDTELINAYYKVFLNRGSDPSGASYWAQQIAGTTNDISILFTGFADSTEFASKCASYGVTVGPHVDVPTTVRGTSSGSTATPAAGASGLAAQTGGMRANSPEELDAYWTSQGFEIFYIDFFKFFGIDDSFDSINLLDGFCKQFSGKAFGDGLFNTFVYEKRAYWGSVIRKYYPSCKDSIEVIGYDWLGRIFATFKGQDCVKLFDVGSGEVINIGCSVEKFLNEEIPFYSNDCLSHQFFDEWKKVNKKGIPYSSCVGYKVPLFLGGKDVVSNLEISDMDVYWNIVGPLLNSK